MIGRRFLDGAYDLPDRRATAAFYADWAASYDAEIADNGYATPARCAAALAAHAERLADPVLDVGCGTGLSGLALAAAGFRTVDGTDLSAEMLARAAARSESGPQPRPAGRGVYRRLFRGDLADPLPFGPGVYANAGRSAREHPDAGSASPPRARPG